MGEFPLGYTPPPLGEGELVRAKMQARTPGIVFHEPTWAQVQGNGWSVDATVGSEEPVESILLHVHGGQDALGVVQRMADALGARALDCSTGKFIDFANHPAGRTVHERHGEPSDCT